MFKIGEVAKRTGVSIRSLRHYDSIGLLSPTGYSDSGYRLYNKQNLMRLQQIVALKQMGFSLKTIKEMFEKDSISLQKTMDIHLTFLKEQFIQQKQIYQQVKHVCDLMSNKHEVSIEEICQTVESIKMLEKYYTSEQLQALKKRSFHLDEKKGHEYAKAWYAIFNSLDDLRQQGVEPSDAKTRPYALKSRELLSEFTQGDKGIEESLHTMYEEEGGSQMLRNHGLDVSDETYQYYQLVLEAHVK
ncbi:MerR family transcriptional regulator [Legionella israelensis]|uniref:MerR family transcriptional regulator n=1 Tax=Legionella israelensis TaxID=454 RepID=UPI00117C0190|nr:MerR family transcriptional regulator [Legionella israelensis]QDP72425.1 MerR family transcriptional regulator [Legionella israelensis]